MKNLSAIPQGQFFFLVTPLFVLGGLSSSFEFICTFFITLLGLKKIFSSVNFISLRSLIFLGLILLTFFQIIFSQSLVHLRLELSFLFLLLSSYYFLNFDLIPNKKSYVVVILKISLISIVSQILINYLLDGNGTLLRGDRNHSAPIIVIFYIFCYFLLAKRELIIYLLWPLNLSRNFLLGLLIFEILNVKQLQDFCFKYKNLIFTLLIALPFIISAIFFAILDNYNITIGSSNDYSRLLQIFDGSNVQRFTLNLFFFDFLIDNFNEMILRTGIYSETGEIFGLISHNSLIQGIYRLGILRIILFIFLIFLFCKTKESFQVFITFFVMSVFIHEMFLSILVVMLCFLIRFNNLKNLKL